MTLFVIEKGTYDIDAAAFYCCQLGPFSVG